MTTHGGARARAQVCSGLRHRGRADGPATALTAPAHLADDPVAWVRARTRRVHPGPADGGRFVLYWAATALRADDNPALDAARLAAHRAGLPLLVYQGLTHRAWYASDLSLIHI